MPKDAKTVLTVLSGLLLIVAGVLHMFSFFPLAGLDPGAIVALAIIVPGIVLLLLGLLGIRPGGSAVLLAVCAALLVVVSSGLTALLTPGFYTKVEERTLTPADLPGPVEELRLSVETDVGSIQLSTTDNRSLLIAVRFLMRVAEEPRLEYELVNGCLRVSASADTASLEVIVASWLTWAAELKTDLGSIEAHVNATLLSGLVLESSLGSIELAVQAPRLASNCSIEARSSLGSVEATVLVGAEVDCEIEARTSLGSVDHEAEGFEEVSSGWGYLLLRSEGFEEASRVLHLSLLTSLGSVDVSARRA